MRNMLTGTRNRHFTERLFYADSLLPYAYSFEMDTVWYNITEYAGNIQNRYPPMDTTRHIFNTIGYNSGNAGPQKSCWKGYKPPIEVRNAM